MNRRRLENLLAPLAVMVVVALVVTLVALRPDPTASTSEAPSPTRSATPASPTPTIPQASPSPGRSDEREGRQRRPPLPRADRLGSNLPNPTCSPQPRVRAVDVLTFNIKSGLGAGRYDLDLIAREIAAWDVDVVLLQEVDRFRARTRATDQPAALAERLGMQWAFGANVRSPGRGEYGTAILSRFPIVGSDNTALPTGPGAQQRGLLAARIEVDDRLVSVYNTHLQHARNYADLRAAQSRALMRVVEGDGEPTLLGGDFNAGQATPTMTVTTAGRMSDSWLAAGDGPGFTVPSGRAVARIDYLLHSPEFTPVDAQVLVSGISDHRAVRASYRIRTQRGCLPPGSVADGRGA